VLCSNCSEQVRPIVAVDIDGTLGNYHDHFTAFASDYTGILLPRSYDGGCKFYEWLEIDLIKYREIKLAYRQGGLKRSMPLIPNAAYFMEQVRRAGAEVWVTTTRPYLRLDNIDPDTRAWAERHGIGFEHLLYDEDKYAQLADRVDCERVVFVLDDLKEQLERANTLFGTDVPWQHHAVWNSHPNAHWSQGHSNLRELAAVATSMVETWYHETKEES
jgi:hypothetical protein